MSIFRILKVKRIKEEVDQSKPTHNSEEDSSTQKLYKHVRYNNYFIKYKH